MMLRNLKEIQLRECRRHDSIENEIWRRSSSYLGSLGPRVRRTAAFGRWSRDQWTHSPAAHLPCSSPLARVKSKRKVSPSMIVATFKISCSEEVSLSKQLAMMLCSPVGRLVVNDSRTHFSSSTSFARADRHSLGEADGEESNGETVVTSLNQLVLRCGFRTF
jgi:hypothetical protein